MAPLAAELLHVHARRDERLSARQVAFTNTTDYAQTLSNNQEITLEWLALAFSIMSVVSSILAFYWFVKMRRSFRHE